MPLLTLDLPVNGEQANAESIIDPLTDIVNLLNGGLDSDNVDNFDGDKINNNTLALETLNAEARKGWVTGITPPSSVSYLGNRSYSLTYASSIAGFKSVGMRNRFTRSVQAPTQCTSLNGSSQYWVKTSPNKLLFTDDFVVSAWVKLSSYAVGGIASRYNGTSGWHLRVTATGKVELAGINAGSGNYSTVVSTVSLPLNKWVHITAQLDMSTFTASTTTSYVMFDGVDVPAEVARAGSNPTALIQAGNLEIGSYNGGTNLFNGKIAQVAIFNSKVTQSTIAGYISQGLSGSETALDSAYSFNNSVVDLNTTTPNDLSIGGGSATATNADSPFGGQASGAISSTLEYGLTLAISSDGLTETIQVPEGCALPTSGGIAAMAYSTMSAPYGMPRPERKWIVEALKIAVSSQLLVVSTVYNIGGFQLKTPIGEGNLNATVNAYCSGAVTLVQTLSTSAAAMGNEYEMGSRDTDAGGASHAKLIVRDAYINNQAATPYYHTVIGTSTPTVQVGGEGIARIWWKPAVL